MKNSFLITCHGRSGSKFLATLMNRSRSWTVTHEASVGDATLEKIQNRFDRDLYGDVSGHHRFHFRELRVKKRGIILRNPRDIFLSCYNRGYSYERLMKSMERINWSWLHLNKWLQRDTSIRKIEFTKMTTDLNYVSEVCVFFGVKDIDFTSIDLSHKINTNKKELHRCDSFELLPSDIQERWKSYGW